jgi:hypothetical protein
MTDLIKEGKIMKRNLASILLSTVIAATLAACGGGSGVTGGNIPLTSAGSPSYVSQGPINGSRIYIDMDDNHRYTPGVDTQCGTTASDGSYICQYPAGMTEATNTHLLIAVGGLDTFTSRSVNQPLMSAPGSTQISPLTTLATLQAASGVPVGTAININTFVQANTTIVNSFGLPVGTQLNKTNSMAVGNEKVLAAESAIQELIETSVEALAAATGTTSPQLANAYGAALQGLLNEITKLQGQVANLSATGPGTIINNVITAVAMAPMPVGTTALTSVGVTNLVSVVNGPIASGVAATQAATTLTAIQSSAANSVTNIAAITQTLNVVKNVINNIIYTGPQIGGIRNVYNVVYKGGYTQNQITTIVNNLATTLNVTNLTQVIVQNTTTAFPNTWVFNSIFVTGNSSVPTAASGVGAITSTLGGSFDIPAPASGVARVGLQTASITLIPNTSLNTLMVTGAAPTTYRANIGMAVTPVNLIGGTKVDTRRIQVVIKNVPVTVNTTGMHITSLAGATLTAFGQMLNGTSFNVTLINLPDVNSPVPQKPLITTATNQAILLPNSTDITLDLGVLFAALGNVAGGGNTGFANLSLLTGAFDVSMAMNLQDLSTLTFPMVSLADTRTAPFDSATQYLSPNAVLVTNTLAEVLGQGKVIRVTLN